MVEFIWNVTRLQEHFCFWEINLNLKDGVLLILSGDEGYSFPTNFLESRKQ